MTKGKKQHTKDYNAGYDAWLEFSENIGKRIEKLTKNGSSSYKDLHELWSEYSQKMTEHMAKFSPGDEILFKKMNETWGDYSNKMGEKFMELMSHEDGPSNELRDIWNDYSETMGKRLSEIVSEQIMEQKELYDIWMDAFGVKEKAHPGVSPDVMDAFGNFWQDLWSKWQPVAPSSGKATDVYETYKGLHDQWNKSYSELIRNLTRTQAFSSMNGNTLDSNLEMIRTNQAFMKDYLGMLGLPTKEHMDEVFLKLYEIDKKMREMNRSINAINEKISRNPLK